MSILYAPAPLVENPTQAARTLAYHAGYNGLPCTYTDAKQVRAWELGMLWRVDSIFAPREVKRTAIAEMERAA